MKNLKPNSRVECIAEYHWFTIGCIYKTDSQGYLIDNGGDPRKVLSVEDEFFFELFKYVPRKSRKPINQPPV